MSPLEAAVLGLVQGLTEFLPISSTAHLRIVPALLGWKDPGAAYSAVIQLGTVGAVLLYFAKDLLQLTRAFLEGLRQFVRGFPSPPGGVLARLRARLAWLLGLERTHLGGVWAHAQGTLLGTQDSRLAWFVGLGTIPIGVCGLLFKKTIETSLRSLYVISGSLILLALVLLVVERVASHKRTLAEMTLKDGLVVGVWQAVALIPGSSRSGTTITGALSLGFSRADAARYSFLLSIPATSLAGLFELKHLLQATEGPGLGMLALGTIVSFVSGLAAIWGLLQFLRSRSTLVFIVYRVVMGAALIALVSTGRVAAMPPVSLADCVKWSQPSPFARLATCEAGLLSVGDYEPVAGESFVTSAIASMKAASPSVTYLPEQTVKVRLGDGEHDAVLVVAQLASGERLGRTLVLEDLVVAGKSQRRGMMCQRLLPAGDDDADCLAALERMRQLPALGTPSAR